MTATKNRNIVNKGTFHDGFKQNDSRCEPSKNPNFINEAKAEVHGLVEQNVNCKNMITGGADEGTDYFDPDVPELLILDPDVVELLMNQKSMRRMNVIQ